MRVTWHAVCRFKERIWPSVDEEVAADAIRLARYGPMYAVLTTRPATGERVWHYLYAGQLAGRGFYVATDRDGAVAYTVLTEHHVATWTRHAIARRLPGPHRETPVKTRGTWEILHA